MSFTIEFTQGCAGCFEEPVQLSEAAASCDLLIEHPCAALGRCGRCRVRFLRGAPPPVAAERTVLERAELASGWRLACQCIVSADALVEIPARARCAAAKTFGPERLAAGGEPLAGSAAEVLALAVDVGTTTLAMALIEARSSRVLATAAALNPQAAIGPDVIARIFLAATQPDGAERLAGMLHAALGKLCRELLASAGVAPRDVMGAVLCGNATMSHCLAGESPASLGTAPYLGRFTAARELAAAELGLELAPGARAWIFPQVRSHVGGDTVAAILASDLDRGGAPRMLIDLGTNTEIVVAAGGRLLASSAAAGPAFEGAGIEQGMRAEPGAIDRVALSQGGALQVHVLGGGAPRGLCGTGLIDAAAAARKLGRLDSTGRLNGSDHLLLASRGGEHVRVSAADFRQLQLVKGSIAAGVQILLEGLELRVEDLADLYLAGAFGAYLRKESALAIGLVPPIEPERIRFLGDAAGIGVRMALCDREQWRRARRVAERSEVVELAFDPRYTELFAAAMAFPEVPGGDRS